MAYLHIDRVRAAARDARQHMRKSDAEILGEARHTDEESFDIFLSHSSMDKELIVGTKRLIEDVGYSVYVDWIDDAELDREAVDRDRADHLRRRMQQCGSLFYLHTPNAALSRWCPWELGYFDALRQPDEGVFVLPVLSQGDRYVGQEYLALYETVDIDNWSPPPRRRRRPTDSTSDPLVDRLLDDRFGIFRRRGPFL
jgi:hypothetical protein